MPVAMGWDTPQALSRAPLADGSLEEGEEKGTSSFQSPDLHTHVRPGAWQIFSHEPANAPISEALLFFQHFS